MPLLTEAFTPLAEKAVRRDGTVGIKIIGPGWGSSGFYERGVLERDVPRVFGPGTHMYWNHPTMSEAMERPERDLRDLAAVVVSQPRWEEQGSQGPGMYAEAAVFAGYREAVDEIAEHIGVSIRGDGITEFGKADGRQGVIVKEIAKGHSVDFVTKPGAGGRITKIFESAPGGERLPAPSIQQFLTEAGRVLSAANEAKLRTALEQLNAVLSQMVVADEPMMQQTEVSESAPMYMNIGGVPVPLAVTTAATSGTGYVATYIPRESAAAEPLNDIQESERMELQEAQEALAERERTIQEQRATIARLQEMSLIREAKDFITGKLATANLPDVSKANLARDLSANPVITDGKLDEAAMIARIDEAVTARQAEIAAALGQTGIVSGMGEGNGGNGVTTPTLAESLKRSEAALGRLGYQGVQGGN